MRPCMKVIVTVNISDPAGTYDMELPTFMHIGELRKKLLETLRLMDFRKFARMGDIEFFHNGQALRENETLAMRGIWDGSIIEIKQKTKN